MCNVMLNLKEPTECLTCTARLRSTLYVLCYFLLLSSRLFFRLIISFLFLFFYILFIYLLQADPFSPYTSSIHARNKTVIGQRLFRQLSSGTLLLPLPSPSLSISPLWLLPRSFSELVISLLWPIRYPYIWSNRF